MNNLALATKGAAATPGGYEWSSKEMHSLLTNTVAQGATHAEFAMFREICRATGLNPFKREIWFIKTERKCQIMTGVNGFYEVANKHPMYDGIEIEYGNEIEAKAGGNRTVVTFDWIEAKVYRKDRSRPQTFRAFWREYAQELVTKNGNFSNWAKMPSVMLSKCAESMALRKAFPQELNGLYTAEEMPREFGQHNALPLRQVSDLELGEPQAEPQVEDEVTEAVVEPVAQAEPAKPAAKANGNGKKVAAELDGII